VIGSYLETLDAVLSQGAADFSPGFVRQQTDYVISRRQPDGGFPGRRGGSDLYYTDFAIRSLALVSPESPALVGAASYLATVRPQPRDAIECFCLLNARRLLAQCGHSVEMDADALLAILAQQALPEGGFKRPRGAVISVYHTFIAALCYSQLTVEFPNAAQAAEAIQPLQGEGGGFAEQPGAGLEQTNATAAALAFLFMTGTLTEEHAQRARSFLAQMQAADGGFRAHAAAPVSDLLSSFTGLATLATFGGPAAVRLRDLAAFIKHVAQPGGGFRASVIDDQADVEYSYYALASLAILRAAISTQDIGSPA